VLSLVVCFVVYIRAFDDTHTCVVEYAQVCFHLWCALWYTSSEPLMYKFVQRMKHECCGIDASHVRCVRVCACVYVHVRVRVPVAKRLCLILVYKKSLK